MEVTLLGMVMLFSSQLANAPEPIVVTLSGIVTFARLRITSSPAKAMLPISVTLLPSIVDGITAVLPPSNFVIFMVFVSIFT